MNLSELIYFVWKQLPAGTPVKVVKQIAEATFEEIAKRVARGESVQIFGFGTFEAKERVERTGHNPRTGEKIKIPAHKLPVFRAGKKFKRSVGGK